MPDFLSQNGTKSPGAGPAAVFDGRGRRKRRFHGSCSRARCSRRPRRERANRRAGCSGRQRGTCLADEDAALRRSDGGRRDHAAGRQGQYRCRLADSAPRGDCGGRRRTCHRAIAGAIPRTAGMLLPVRAKKRSVYVFDCRSDQQHAPLTIDPGGTTFQPGNRLYLGTASPPEDEDPDSDPLDFKVDHAPSDNVIWPALAYRVPAFESVKTTTFRAGRHDYNLFEPNAISGSHPEIAGLLLCNGFSGQRSAGGCRRPRDLRTDLVRQMPHNRSCTLRSQTDRSQRPGSGNLCLPACAVAGGPPYGYSPQHPTPAGRFP